SVSELLRRFGDADWSGLLGTLIKDDPKGLGRIVRDDEGRFVDIVEEKDATAEQRAIGEVNMSTYVFQTQPLLWALSRLENANAQGEFYLTDCPRILREADNKVEAIPLLKPCESLSVNTMEELAIVESQMRSMGYPG